MRDETSRVLTLVFTDLADSTALKTKLGDRAVHDLIEAHRSHVVRLAGECAGRIVDWAGDGCFLTFETSSAGVLFALQLQQIHAKNPDLPGVRIGMHMGEVSERTGPQGPQGPPRIDGLAVDIAARICGLAQPGQVLMSAAVHDSARQRVGVEAFGKPVLWQTHGTYALKGFDKELVIGEAGLEGFASLGAPKAGDKARLIRRAKPPGTVKRAFTFGRTQLAFGFIVVLLAIIGVLVSRNVLDRSGSPPRSRVESPIESLAVLPLDNLMNDPEQDFFADGMTEAITAELAKIRALKVISRTSVMRYKDTDLSIPEIAGQLGVQAVVEGSVLREEDDVRITVQLIDGRTDAHLWSESYTETISSVLKLQSDVALAIAGEIRVALTPAERDRIASARNVDPEAYNLYLRGLQSFSEFSPPGMQRVRKLLARAVEIDPEFAEAWSGISTAHIVSANMNMGSPREHYEDAHRAALKAIEIDPGVGRAHAELGFLAFLREQDWETAKSRLASASVLSPNDPAVYLLHSYYHLMTGEFDLVSENARRALELDPYTPFNACAAGLMLVVGDHADEGFQVLQELVERNPRDIQARYMASVAELATGKFDAALDDADRLVSATGNSPVFRVYRTVVLAAAGREREALDLVDSLEAAVSPGVLSKTMISIAHARLGNLDAAFHWLEMGAEEPNFQYLLSLRVFPYLDTFVDDPNIVRFRTDPRYFEIINEENFPQLPTEHPGYEEEQAWRARKADMEAANAPIRRIAGLPFDNIE